MEKRPWYQPKINWGFWVLIITFTLFLITLVIAKSKGWW